MSKYDYPITGCYSGADYSGWSEYHKPAEENFAVFIERCRWFFRLRQIPLIEKDTGGWNQEA